MRTGGAVGLAERGDIDPLERAHHEQRDADVLRVRVAAPRLGVRLERVAEEVLAALLGAAVAELVAERHLPAQRIDQPPQAFWLAAPR